MNGEDDDILDVRNLKSGSEAAFDRLFDRYKISLYKICYRYARNDADALELTQDIFIKVYRNIRKFNEKAKFFTWLYRIAVNTCISFKRRHRVEVEEVEIDSAGEEQSVHGAPAVQNMHERVRMKMAIDSALSKVPERQRLTFILHHYEGYKFVEIWPIMGITTGAAKANYHQAVKKLRLHLRDWL